MNSRRIIRQKKMSKAIFLTNTRIAHKNCSVIKKKCYICIVPCIFSAGAQNKKKEKRIMAKPIKETPVLYDEDAYRFEMEAHHVTPLSEERQEEMFRTYEEVRKCCTFAL